jgi:hypothetical protein
VSPIAWGRAHLAIKAKEAPSTFLEAGLAARGDRPADCAIGMRAMGSAMDDLTAHSALGLALRMGDQ